jgi:hypothetical protein
MRPLLLVEVSDAALVRQGGSRAARCNLLESANYVPLTIDDTSGVPVPWTLSGSPMSSNMVAVHNRRDFGLLVKPRRKAPTMTPKLELKTHIVIFGLGDSRVTVRQRATIRRISRS